jgi:outer membrane protein
MIGRPGFLIAGLLLAVLLPAGARASGLIAPQNEAPVATIPPAAAAPPAAGMPQGGAASAAPPGSSEYRPLAPGAELTLDAAISIALRNHPRAKEANDESRAAGERLDQARSYLGPQVFGVAEYLRTTDNGIGNTSYYDPDGVLPRLTGTNHNLPANDFSQNSSTSDNYAGGIAVSQFLFDLGRRRGFVAQRRFEADAASGQERFTDLDLIFEVSRSYFDLLEAGQMVRVFEKAVEQRQFHRHEAEVKAQAGLRPQLDVYVTQAEVQRAQLHLVDARNAQADAKAALDNALGLGESAPDYHPADVMTYSSIRDTFESLLKTSFKLRPDLRALEDQARAMGAQVTEYRSDYFPTLSAAAGYAGVGTGLPVVNNFNVGIVLTWPIFNSFLTTHQIAEARFRQSAIEHANEDLRQRIILEVKTAFLNWQSSLQRIDRAEQALAASRVELELAERRYQAGLSDIVELEDAQRNYTEDDAEYANSLYGYSLAAAAVDRASARSLTKLN